MGLPVSSFGNACAAAATDSRGNTFLQTSDFVQVGTRGRVV